MDRQLSGSPRNPEVRIFPDFPIFFGGNCESAGRLEIGRSVRSPLKPPARLAYLGPQISDSACGRNPHQIGRRRRRKTQRREIVYPLTQFRGNPVLRISLFLSGGIANPPVGHKSAVLRAKIPESPPRTRPVNLHSPISNPACGRDSLRNRRRRHRKARRCEVVYYPSYEFSPESRNPNFQISQFVLGGIKNPPVSAKSADL